MSLEFSRRAFLKYSAVAAVALAGAGVFSGCEQSDPYNLYMYKAGEMTVLQITAGMGYDEKQKKYVNPVIDTTVAEIEFPFKVTNNRTNPVSIDSNHFKVTVYSKDQKTSKKYSVSVDDDLYDTNLAKGATSSGKVTVKGLSGLEAGGKVVLSYCPDTQYNEYSLNWALTCTEKEESSGSGDSSEGEVMK